MRIEPLCVDNLREGVFCAAGKPHSNEMYTQLEAWLGGERLRGQVCRDTNGEVAGFVLYYPIEHAPLDVSGDGMYMVQCLYVKPEYQSQGVGRALVESAIADARNSGASGLAVEGFQMHKHGTIDFMPGTFFQHMGMTPGESRGSASFYYMGFNKENQPPGYMQPNFRVSQDLTKLRIDIFDCRKCYVGITNRELIETVANQLNDPNMSVEVNVHDQTSREAVVDKGMSSGVFVDGKLTYFQGPMTEEDVWNAIEVAISAKRQASDR